MINPFAPKLKAGEAAVSAGRGGAVPITGPVPVPITDPFTAKLGGGGGGDPFVAARKNANDPFTQFKQPVAAAAAAAPAASGDDDWWKVPGSSPAGAGSAGAGPLAGSPIVPVPNIAIPQMEGGGRGMAGQAFEKGMKFGDWVCAEDDCGFVNFASRSACHKCKTPKSKPAGPVKEGEQFDTSPAAAGRTDVAGPRDGHWRVPMSNSQRFQQQMQLFQPRDFGPGSGTSAPTQPLAASPAQATAAGGGKGKWANPSLPGHGSSTGCYPKRADGYWQYHPTREAIHGTGPY